MLAVRELAVAGNIRERAQRVDASAAGTVGVRRAGKLARVGARPRQPEAHAHAHRNHDSPHRAKWYRTARWKRGRADAALLSVRHALASSRLGGRLGRAFDEGIDGPGGWWILDEPELHLGDDILVPDLAGWRVERMPDLPQTSYFELAPDWICEVVSPSTVADDRAEKMPAYAAAAVAHAWLVDPIARTLEVFRREGARWLLLATSRDTGLVRAEPFEALDLELDALWRAPARG